MLLYASRDGDREAHQHAERAVSMTPRLINDGVHPIRLDPFQNIVGFSLADIGPDIVTWNVALMFDNSDLPTAHFNVNRDLAGVMKSLKLGGPDLGFDPADPALQVDGVRSNFVVNPHLQSAGALPDFTIPNDPITGFPVDIILARYGINQFFSVTVPTSVVGIMVYLDGPLGLLDPSEYGYPFFSTDLFGRVVMTGTDGRSYAYPGMIPTWDGVAVSTFGSPFPNYAVDKT